MNERIRGFADEATKFSAIMALPRGESGDELFVEKFAELIIRDCISQIAMIGISNFENDDVGWTVDKSIENIRKHFGVEE